MVDIIQKWALGFVGAAVFCAVSLEITPKGKVKSVQKMLCGAVMAIALFYPLLKMDMGVYSLNMAQYRAGAAEAAGRAQEISNSLSRTFIEEECEAYILDKAKEKGQDISSVKVNVKWSSEGVWYPVGAEIDGKYSSVLSQLMEAELGIARSEQVWNGYEND